MILADYVEVWVCARCKARSAPFKAGFQPENWFHVRLQRNSERLNATVCSVSCLSRLAGTMLNGPWGPDWRTFSERSELEQREKQETDG